MTNSTHLHLASETSGPPGLSSGGLGTPLGRVGAEIVCDDTLVQYAAYWLFSLLLARGWEWYHSIPIILVGMALHLSFSQVSVGPPRPPWLLSALGGSGKSGFFWRLC